MKKNKIITFAFIMLMIISSLNLYSQPIDCGVSNLHITFGSLQISGQQCYVDVSYKWDFTPYNPSDTSNPMLYPRGIDAYTTSPVLITGMTPLTGFNNWAGETYSNPSCTSTPTTSVGWYSSNIIPTTTTLTFRIFINTNGSANFVMRVRVLNQFFAGDCLNGWSCYRENTFSTNYVPTITGLDCMFSGSATQLNISPAPPAGSTIEWYRAPYDYSIPGCPAISTSSPWVNVQSGINSTPHNTNIQTSSQCYYAVVRTPCFSYVTPVFHLRVCPNCANIPGITFTSNPAGHLETIANLGNTLHACQTLSGQLNIGVLSDCGTLTWKWKSNHDNSWNSLPSTSPVNFPMYTYQGNPGCRDTLTFSVHVDNQCGGVTCSVDRTLTIYIDDLALNGFTGPSISANPDNMCGNCPACNNVANDPNIAVLCYNRATRLTYNYYCTENIVGWESSVDNSTWSSIPGAGTSQTFWTNKLLQTTYYRIQVENGACNNNPPDLTDVKKYTAVFEVRIKPKLTASISGNNMVCPPLLNTILTSSSSYDGTNYCVQYKWFKDGVEINGQTQQTLTVTEPGNYYAIVSDKACDTEVKTNVIRVCKPELIITGPCGLCPNEVSGTLTAGFIDQNCMPTGCSYSWKKDGIVISGATSNSITIYYADLPAVYEVTATCSNCGPYVVTKKVIKCPQ